MKDEIADAHRETAKKIKTVFETIDADRSGELDMQEFKDAMEMMGSEMDDEAIEVIPTHAWAECSPRGANSAALHALSHVFSPTLTVPR